MASKHDYDTTIARMAGNIAAGVISALGHNGGFSLSESQATEITTFSVGLAADIVTKIRKNYSGN